ncbi:MAG TPA: hypothetical protein VKU40_19570, partial [Thermoanaerobaculia bacterium]|nr:hypothetical protein [Thermoanaerobaculia bacterium]
EYGAPEDRRLDLVAAALLAGRPDDAAAWFAAVPPRQEKDDRPTSDADPWPALGYALARAGAGEVTSDADPFDLFASLIVGSFGDDLWGRDTLLRLLVRIAGQERFDAIADHLASELADSVLDLELDEAVFPVAMSDARALQRQWLGELTRALPARAELTADEPLAPREARHPAFEARPLADLDIPLPLHPPAAADGVTPPAGFAPVRVERDGDQVIVLALSQALDPVGELSQGGYWVLRSHDRGANWQALYTSSR